jgi:hypothetical protein
MAERLGGQSHVRVKKSFQIKVNFWIQGWRSDQKKSAAPESESSAHYHRLMR